MTTKKEIKFNINEEVKVKLNAYGLNIYTEKMEKVNEWLNSVHGKCVKMEVKIDENGYTKFQLWDLMHLFGPHMVLGMDIPFTDTEIVFLVESEG